MFVNLKVDHFIHYMPTLHLMLLCTHFKRSWIYNHYTISVAKLLCYNIFEIRIHQCNVTILLWNDLPLHIRSFPSLSSFSNA